MIRFNIFLRSSSKSPVIELGAPDISIVKVEARDIKEEIDSLNVDVQDKGGAFQPEIDKFGKEYGAVDSNEHVTERPHDGGNLYQRPPQETSEKGRF